MTWISVKDRLPEDESLVLVFDEGWIGTAQLNDGVFWDDSAIVPVTHWMPLPFGPTNSAEFTAKEKAVEKWPDAHCAHWGQKHCRKYAIASLKKNDYLSGWKSTEAEAWQDAASRLE